MKSLFVIVLLFIFLLSNNIIGQSNEQKSVSVTVYNQNLGVVKDLRSIDISSGRSKINNSAPRLPSRGTL